MKIVTIIGVRPEFTKAVVVSKVIKEYDNIEEVLVHTGQHYTYRMNKIFLNQLELPKPEYNLGIRELGHGKMTGRMLEKIEKVLIKEKPKCVIVYGDTNSTLAGTLASVKLGIPTAHVESGLRVYDFRQPEEINRVLIDSVSKLLFAPTELSFNTLLNEDVRGDVFFTGDVMYDAYLQYRNNFVMKGLPKEYCLATVHRQENVSKEGRLRNIFEALSRLAKSTPVILPIHPGTMKVVNKLSIPLDDLIVIKPVSYFGMLSLIQNANVVLTDSGGIPKEAYFMKVPTVILNDYTGWRELEDIGWNLVSGIEVESIIECCNKLRLDKPEWVGDLYGKGDAGKQIVEAILWTLK